MGTVDIHQLYLHIDYLNNTIAQQQQGLDVLHRECRRLQEVIFSNHKRERDMQADLLALRAKVQILQNEVDELKHGHDIPSAYQSNIF